MNTSPPIRLELSSNPLYLAGARELVYHLASRLGFSDEACGQMALAVDEAICNVIRHGYDRELGRPIWITLAPQSGAPAHPGEQPPTNALKIVIEDEAKQVDVTTIKSRNLDDIRPGGLGVHIITEVMDDVKWEHRQPKGMRLTMVKRRDPAASLNGPVPAAPSTTAQPGSTPGKKDAAA